MWATCVCCALNRAVTESRGLCLKWSSKKAVTPSQRHEITGTKFFQPGPYSLMSGCCSQVLSLLLLHLFLAGVRLLTGRLHGVQDKWDAFWWCQCRYQPHPSGLMAQSLLFNPLYLLLMHYPSLQCVLLLWDLILSTLSGHALFSPIPACLMRWCISLSSNFPEQRRRLRGAHLNWKQDQIWPDPPLALIFSNFSCWNDKLYQNKLSKELWWFTLAVDLALWRYPEYISINIISLQAPQHQLFLSCFINIHLKEDRPLKKNKTRIGIACCRGFVRTTLPFIVPQICDLSLTKLPHFFFPITETIQETSAVLQNKSMVRWKWMWGSKTLCKEKKKKVKKLPTEKSVKVAGSSCLISMNMSCLISFTSSIYYRSVLCWKPFSKLRKCLITSQALCESQGVGMFCVWGEPCPCSLPDACQIVLWFGHASMDTF